MNILPFEDKENVQLKVVDNMRCLFSPVRNALGDISNNPKEGKVGKTEEKKVKFADELVVYYDDDINISNFKDFKVVNFDEIRVACIDDILGGIDAENLGRINDQVVINKEENLVEIDDDKRCRIEEGNVVGIEVDNNDGIEVDNIGGLEVDNVGGIEVDNVGGIEEDRLDAVSMGLDAVRMAKLDGIVVDKMGEIEEDEVIKMDDNDDEVEIIEFIPAPNGENNGILVEKVSEVKEEIFINICVNGKVIKITPPPPIADIDDKDLLLMDKNYSSTVNFYLSDMFGNYRDVEENYTVKTPYYLIQPNINNNMRVVLIDWLVDVHYKLKLLNETLFLAVNYIDRFLANRTIRRNDLQLVGLTCMFIASKYEEIFFPNIKDFLLLAGSNHTKAHVLRYEGVILNGLKFELGPPTICTFIERFIKVMNVKVGHNKIKELHLHIVTNMARYFSERLLLEIEFVKYKPSLIASACILLAGQYYPDYIFDIDEFFQLTGYHECECAELAKSIDKCVREGKPIFQAVWRKYTRSIRCKVSYIVHEVIGNADEYFDTP